MRHALPLRALVLVLVLLPLGGCVEMSAPLTPSAIIVPDAISIAVGEAQVFSVKNASVVRFELSAENQRWSECIAIDATYEEANAIRIVAQSRCKGLVYVTAIVGAAHTPLVAVMSVL